jgi:hypothetical protein
MGNNPSKPNSVSPTGSSSSNSHRHQSSSSSHKRDGSKQQRDFYPTDSAAIKNYNTPEHFPDQHPDSLSPPRKPSLRPQQAPSANTRGEGAMGNSQSQEKQEQKKKERDIDTHSSPVQVPTSAQQARNRVPVHQIDPVLSPRGVDFVPASNLNYPPRLPLPIQEEVYTPGSPIITPDDLSNALRDDPETTLPHHASLLSHTTLDEDEDVDLLDQVDKGKTVPTTIEWKQPGNKVYITGTFAGWSKKYRMHRK